MGTLLSLARSSSTPVYPYAQTNANANTIVKKMVISDKTHALVKDNCTTQEELQNALRNAGIESSNLMIGINFSKSSSNITTNKSDIVSANNHILSVFCTTFNALNNNDRIFAYGFGYSKISNKTLFPFQNTLDDMESDNLSMGVEELDTGHKLETVLELYNKFIHDMGHDFANIYGPISFAPLIHKAIDHVKKTSKYTILLIICDEIITRREETIDAIAEAAKYPLSIICIGVGKVSFDIMEEFDEYIPDRPFNNFHFINLHKLMKECDGNDIEFAKNALRKLPDQYDFIKGNYL